MAEFGTNGDDFIIPIEAEVFGLDGSDIIKTTIDNSYLHGGNGDDFLSMTGGSAGSLYGGAGNDGINGGQVGDTILGGGGNDILVGGEPVLADFNVGTVTPRMELVWVSSGGTWFPIYLKVDSGDDLIFGGNGGDGLYGFNGNDVLFGGEGDDTQTTFLAESEQGIQTTFTGGLYGGDGQDILFGGAGNDYMEGGNGDDIFYPGSGDSVVYGGGGEDFVDGTPPYGSTMTFYGGHEDDIAYGANGSDYLSGDEDNDFLWGAHGDDFVLGGSGDDQIVGYHGNDALYGGTGADAFNFYYDLALFSYDFDYIADFSMSDGDYVLFDSTHEDNITFFDYNGVAYAYISGITPNGTQYIAFDGGVTSAEVQSVAFFI